VNELKSNLYECKHCAGSGTCSNGKDGSSCLVCAERNDLPFWKRTNQHGLVCGCCGGIGMSEPLTERINKRIAPMLALFIIAMLMALIFIAAITESKFFSEILAFTSAIIGTVVGYYFSNSRSQT
jgi:hypothetical protein